MSSVRPSDCHSQAAQLVSKIVTLKSNPHYRMSDVVYSRPYRWQDSAEKVLALPEFEGTLLRQYLEVNSVGAPPNLRLLRVLVEQAIATHGYKLPERDELVVHIRAGDVVEHDWFMQRNYAEEIGRYGNVSRCSIVTCFAFQEFVERQWWMFSEEKLSKNIAKVTALFEDLLARYPSISFDVVSNRDIDQDFVYMVMAPHFIRDAGGFSELAENVRACRVAVL